MLYCEEAHISQVTHFWCWQREESLWMDDFISHCRLFHYLPLWSLGYFQQVYLCHINYLIPLSYVSTKKVRWIFYFILLFIRFLFYFYLLLFKKKPLVLAMPYVTIDFFSNHPLFMWVFVCLCECMEHYYRYSKRAKSVSHPLQLDLEMIVSHLTWILGTKFRLEEQEVLSAPGLSLQPLTILMNTQI